MAKTQKKKAKKYQKPRSTLAKALPAKRKANCKKNFTSKCNSEFLRDAYRIIARKEGYKGVGGGFSINQRGEALKLAAKMKKGAHYTGGYKKQIASSKVQKKKKNKKALSTYLKNYKASKGGNMWY